MYLEKIQETGTIQNGHILNVAISPNPDTLKEEFGDLLSLNAIGGLSDRAFVESIAKLYHKY